MLIFEQNDCEHPIYFENCYKRYGCNVAIASRKMDRLQAAKRTLEDATGKKCMIAQMDVRKVDRKKL